MTPDLAFSQVEIIVWDVSGLFSFLLRQVLPGVAAATSGGNVEAGGAGSPAQHLAVGA